MSLDIDMQTFALSGATDQAAADHSQDTSNFYHNETQDGAMFPELVNNPIKVDEPSQPALNQEQAQNPQAENFRALREEIDRIKSERDAEKRELQMQLDMYKANAISQQSQQRQEIPQKQMFEGLKDDDVLNVGELKRELQQREAMYQERLAELQVQQKFSDYNEVLEKFALPLIKQKPHLAEGIQGASNKALYAYELGKMYQQMQQAAQVTQAPSTPQKSESAQRIVENARKPGTLSGSGGQSTLSKADYFASMSDAEFMRFAGKNLDSI